ncbi:Protein of unknown function [Pilibacter termitis]|uniref:DUF2929 family protein n=1 Tax=Pilibacter termitis TaxID=263852 RepID=A0A1T4PDZ1_9ENTE|nr:DUF2929 family protein [Pilibacter termitis]SJZ89028.1 Protein of unknown function [Pilibacter termitis]
MKYVIVTFWAIILGQVVGYIATSLAGVKEIPVVQMLILSLIVEIILIAIIKIAIPKEKTE